MASLVTVYKSLRRIRLRQSVKQGVHESSSLHCRVEKLSTCGYLLVRLLFMHANGSLYKTVPANGEQSLYACLAMRVQSVAMLTPNYYSIFCIVIKSSQKMAYPMNTLYIK